MLVCDLDKWITPTHPAKPTTFHGACMIPHMHENDHVFTAKHANKPRQSNRSGQKEMKAKL